MAGAAKELFVTPQALQEQIKKLEDELGAHLLVRSRAGCAPTEAGRVFYTGVSRIVPELEALVATTVETDKRDSMTLASACAGLINDGLFGSILADYSRLRPDLRLVMRQVAYADAGAFDIVNGDTRFAPGAYEEINHVFAHCYIVMRTDHPLLDSMDERHCVTVEDLAQVILYAPDQSLPETVEPRCIRDLYTRPRDSLIEFPTSMRAPNVDIALFTQDCVMLCYGPLRSISDRLVQVRLADSRFEYRVYAREDSDKPYSKEFCDYMRRRYNQDWSRHIARIEELTGPKLGY